MPKNKLKLPTSWQPKAHWLRIKTIDAHTGGEPLRVILSGFPALKGSTILERRQYAKKHFDHIRKALMWEPRGHADMYGCIITPPVTKEADFGVLFIHNEGFSTMCGHGIIAVTKVVLETGMLPMLKPESEVKIDTPAGLVTAYARIDNDAVKSVYFRNVPSYVMALDQKVKVPGIGKVKFDIAFGGAFYAFVQAETLRLELTSKNFRNLIENGMAIKHAVMENFEIKHPFEKDLNFLYGTIIIGPPEDKFNHSRNVCIFAEGEVDRSPTGTGVSARMAIHFARKQVKVNEPITIESIIGSTFSGRVYKTTHFGDHEAVIPEVEGTAYITGRHEFLIDPSDPFRDGFILR
jgi:proline racemase